MIAALGAPPARAAWMLPPVPIRSKDFTLVKRDGLYHVFYIRSDLSLPPDSTENDLGHAVSANFFSWTQLAPVLAARDTSWDRDHVWAPSIVERDSVYYMFYTGVVNEPGVYDFYQRIGVATSTDLMQWNRMDTPILSCASVPWSVCDSVGALTALRDPFVMADPTTPGRWLMYYSTIPAADPSGMIVGVAASDGDFTAWSDLKPLWKTHWTYSYNDVVESPHVFSHAGLWYLFFTTSAGQHLSFATSPDPLSDPAGWIYRGRLGTMLGLNTASWFASEYFADGTGEYFAFVNGDRIEVMRMIWRSDGTFYLVQPDLFRIQHMTWGAPQVLAGQPVTLNIEATAWYGSSIRVDAFELDAGGIETPVPLADLGLPDPIPLDGDVTSYVWIAHDVPDGDDDGPGAEIVLKLRDRTCQTPLLTVLPDTTGDPGEDPPPVPQPELHPGDDPSGTDGTAPVIKLRTLRGALLAGGTALLADLQEETAARLDIFDLQGRRIRTLVERALPRGATVVTWDERDAAGRGVPRGVYFARLTTPRAVRTARVLVAR